MDDRYTNRLSDYIDDEDLDPRERAEIVAHLRECRDCRTLVAELSAVAARASALPDVAPATNLWPGIAERLVGAVLPFSPAQGGRRRISFTIPQALAAGLALMVLSGGMVWLAHVGGSRTDVPAAVASTVPRERVEPTDLLPANLVPADFADEHYDRAIADLEKTLDAGRNRLDPQTVRVLEENLLAIDRAIDQSRRALSADPANIFLNTHLASARNRKLALLRSATALASSKS